MPELRELYLDYNHFGDEGVSALVDALREGAAPKLAVVAVGGNSAHTQQLQQVLADRKRHGDLRGGDSRREEETTERCSRD